EHASFLLDLGLFEFFDCLAGNELMSGHGAVGSEVAGSPEHRPVDTPAGIAKDGPLLRAFPCGIAIFPNDVIILRQFEDQAAGTPATQRVAVRQTLST